MTRECREGRATVAKRVVTGRMINAHGNADMIGGFDQKP